MGRWLDLARCSAVTREAQRGCSVIAHWRPWAADARPKLTQEGDPEGLRMPQHGTHSVWDPPVHFSVVLRGVAVPCPRAGHSRGFLSPQMWEEAITLGKELAEQYENELFDYEQLSELLVGLSPGIDSPGVSTSCSRICLWGF